MKPEIIFDIYKELQKDSISFVYQGHFSNLVLSMATDLIRNHLEKEFNLINLRNKLSFLMIESFQNIVRYADSHRQDEVGHLTPEIFLTRNIDDTFYIITSNLIENEKIGYVKEKLFEVNNLDEEALKLLYINVLKNRQISEKGGAGLGFIEMVRKTKGKLEFDFVPVNEKVSFFYFQIILKAEDEKNETLLDIRETKKLHKIFSDEKVLLIHKGDFSQEALKHVLIMVEDNTRTEALSNKRKIFHMLVETLQNISKHAYSNNGHKEGTLIICKDAESYTINTGNLVEKPKSKKFQKYLKDLMKLSKDELDEQYKKVLREGSMLDSVEHGLGFIDITRECYNNVSFKFFNIDQNLDYFTLSLHL